MPGHPGDATPFRAEADALRRAVDTAIEVFTVNEAAAAILAYVDSANRYFVQAAPWSLLGKTEDAVASELVDRTLAELFEGFAAVADCLALLLPDASERLHGGLDRVSVTALTSFRFRANLNSNQDLEGKPMAEEIVELAGEVISGVADAALDLGDAATGRSRRSRRGFRVFALCTIVFISAVAAWYFIF